MIIIVCLFFFVGCFRIVNPGSGVKRGYIVRLEHTGVFCKTIQGELIRGSMTDGSGSFGGSLYFTIEDDHNLELANRAVNKNIEVKIYYQNEFFSSIFRSELSVPNFVTHIELLDK